MIGEMQNSWAHTWSDIWEPLNSYEMTPADFFVQVYSTAIDFVFEKPTQSEYEEIVNDPEKAEIEFKGLQAKHFRGELAILRFLEQVYFTLKEYDINEVTAEYKKLINVFVAKYNLRYSLQEPFRFRFRIHGTFADLYTQLQEINEENSHLKELMTDFEESYSAFVLSQSNKDLKTCIAKASNYAEGVASFSLNRNETLGKACEALSIWPHAAIKDSIKNLYKFCSDYPSLRHSGNPSSKIRDLESKDTMLVSLLLISFSGYLNTQVVFE